MEQSCLIIEREKLPVTKIVGRGRKKGNGFNMKLLSKMKIGDSLWDIPLDKMHSIRSSAFRGGFKIQIRKQPHNAYFAIWRIG